jgi:hypothetical protein
MCYNVELSPAAISPLFLEQLPKGAIDLQLDDLTCPTAILRSLATSTAYGPASNIRHSLVQTLLDLVSWWRGNEFR